MHIYDSIYFTCRAVDWSAVSNVWQSTTIMSAGDIITTFSIWLLLIVEAYADGLNAMNNLYTEYMYCERSSEKHIFTLLGSIRR